MKLNCNCCDGIYNSFDIHFTANCDNKCSHCIDNRFFGKGLSKPNIHKIVKTIVDNCDGYDDVLFLGGEPCLYLEDLINCVELLKRRTKLKLFVTTSVPKVCYDKRDKFEHLISLLDGLNLSVQHYDESVADTIRRTKSKYDRQEFYNSLPQKHKIRINLNVVKPYLYLKDDIYSCLKHYDQMGFNSIKISEIQHGEDFYVSFSEVFNLEGLGSPYSDGCQTYINLEGIETPLLLKRSCFLCEESLTASISDGFKLLTKFFTESVKTNKYGVVYGNGELEKGWV